VAALGAFGRDVERMPQGHVTLVRAVARLRTAPVTASAPARAAAAPSAPAPSEALEEEARDAVTVEARLAPGHEEVRAFRIELKVRKGFHAYAHEPGGEGTVPTRLLGVLGHLESVRYPAGEPGPDGIRAYRGTVVIEGTIRMPQVGAPSVELHYQVCDEGRCLPPVSRLVRL
jgi:DsbC/DsbD-like thiol-disulfide interchange protein